MRVLHQEGQLVQNLGQIKSGFWIYIGLIFLPVKVSALSTQSTNVLHKNKSFSLDKVCIGIVCLQYVLPLCSLSVSESRLMNMVFVEGLGTAGVKSACQ